MFVIKASLKDETRRLCFDGLAFPDYEDVQQKVSRGTRCNCSILSPLFDSFIIHA